MTGAAPPRKARVREAQVEDFERVYPLLRQLNDTRMTRPVWHRLFEPLWRGEGFCPGYVLEDNELIGGFIGTLYSARLIHGREHRLCNLTSWVVLPEYRSQSVMLLLPILRDKAVTLTSLTSSVEAYAVYKKLGFADLDTSARVIYRSPLPGRRGYQIATGEDCLAQLGGASLQVGRDHEGLDIIHCLVSRGDDGACYLLLESKRARAHVHHISDVLWFRRHVSAFRRALLNALGLRTLQVDERFLQQKKLFLSRAKVFDQPKQFRSRELGGDDIDALYSELAVLATEPVYDDG